MPNGKIENQEASADLYGADLYGANLSDANLRSANLYGADLREIKKDFFERLTITKNEVAGLYDYLMRGEINGLVYEGECACFIGTIAKVAAEQYKELSSGLRPDSESPTEKWFLNIRKGYTPQSNQFADITREWIEEFAKEHSIALPEYRLVSNIEFPEAFKGVVR